MIAKQVNTEKHRRASHRMPEVEFIDRARRACLGRASRTAWHMALCGWSAWGHRNFHMDPGCSPYWRLRQRHPGGPGSIAGSRIWFFYIWFIGISHNGPMFTHVYTYIMCIHAHDIG